MDEIFPWGWGNEVLYRMCRERPQHTDNDVISGKLWLIGRAYSAAIERGAGDAIIAGKDLHQTIAPEIKASPLDAWLKEISDIEFVDKENLSRVLAVHQRFTLLMKRLTKRERRSFTSKYLHFHNPNAFIYDSRATAAVRKCVGRRRFPIPNSCTEADDVYATFVLRCIEFRDTDAKSGQPPLTPRQLDQLLLGYGLPPR